MRTSSMMVAGACAVAAMVAGLAPMAQADTNVYIWCTAQIYQPGAPGKPDAYMSLELPKDPIAGEAWWNIGQLPLGGVADSWYDGGPGKFRIKNSGNVACYIHIFAASDLESYNHATSGWQPYGIQPTDRVPPAPPSWADWPQATNEPWFALAVAVNVLDVAPRWNVLDQFLPHSNEYGFDISHTFGKVLGQAMPGEYLVFDLKFWAPQAIGGMPYIQTADMAKLVRFEAAAFPRWPMDTWVR
jgi:hypothetical protein